MTPHFRLRSVAALGLALCAVLLPSARAHAATGGDSTTIRSASVQDGQLRVVVHVTGTGTGSNERPALTLDGQPIPAHVVTSTRTSTAMTTARSVVLLVDASGSMRGAHVDAAKSAALQFLAAVPGDVRVGLVVFNDRVTVAVAPTTDRSRLKGAVAAIRAVGGTKLYDGLTAAVSSIGSVGDRRILLLSDGADSSSRTSIDAASRSLSGSGVRLTAVGFGGDASNTTALEHLAAAGHGTVIRTSSAAALAGTFRTSAQAYSSELVLTADAPSTATGQKLPLSVTLTTSSGTTTASTTVDVPAAAPVSASTPPPRTPPRLAPNHALLFGGIGAVGAGVVLLTALALGGRGQAGGKRLRRSLAPYLQTPEKVVAERPSVEPSAFGNSALARKAVELASQVSRSREGTQAQALRLDRAGIPLRPAEWLVVRVVLAVVAGGLLTLLSGNIIMGLIGAVLAVVATRAFLSIRFGRRQKAFLAQMPDSLQLLAGSLSAGYSLPQALDGLVRDGPQPMAGEVSRALAEARIGVQLEDALDHVADRIDIEDFKWIVMAIRTQRQVGGNLAEVLRNVSVTIRERAKLRRQVRALSAEGRLSAYILMALPIGVAAFEFTFRRSYIRPLYTTPPGLVMVFAALVFLAVGWFWMSRVVKVKV